MNAPAIVRRHPSLRWLVPVAVVGVAGLAATGVFHAQATSDPTLPDTSPAALLTAMQSPHLTGFSGTVVSRLSLGLPELPTTAASGDGAQITSLLTGSHTLQVWYGGADKQRIALLGATDETDVFRSGRQMWQWSSAKRTAVHAVLPADHAAQPLPPTAAASLTPSALAGRALDTLDPSTKVTVRAGRQVADRRTYELVLTPRTTDTRVGSVRVDVDGATKLPLGVQVFARGAGSPAVDVAFTSIRFAAPADSNFRFSPPAGAKVHQLRLKHTSSGTVQAVPSQHRSDTSTWSREIDRTGHGWSTVYSYSSGKSLHLSRSPLADSLTEVSGRWGDGRLFVSPLLCALVTSDGRVYAGAVDPDALYSAAARK